jgi:hypothetical protein
VDAERFEKRAAGVLINLVVDALYPLLDPRTRG